MPLLYLLTFIVGWIYVNFWVAFIYALALPWLGLFAFYYWRFVVKTGQNIRFRCLAATLAKRKIKELRDNIHERLNKLLL
jgi:hypothetical protein